VPAPQNNVPSTCRPFYTSKNQQIHYWPPTAPQLYQYNSNDISKHCYTVRVEPTMHEDWTPGRGVVLLYARFMSNQIGRHGHAESAYVTFRTAQWRSSSTETMSSPLKKLERNFADPYFLVLRYNTVLYSAKLVSTFRGKHCLVIEVEPWILLLFFPPKHWYGSLRHL
jgi:hypothetical protein